MLHLVHLQSYRGEASAWLLVLLAVLSALLRYHFNILPLPLPSALGGSYLPLLLLRLFLLLLSYFTCGRGNNLRTHLHVYLPCAYCTLPPPSHVYLPHCTCACMPTTTYRASAHQHDGLSILACFDTPRRHSHVLCALRGGVCLGMSID